MASVISYSPRGEGVSLSIAGQIAAVRAYTPTMAKSDFGYLGFSSKHRIKGTISPSYKLSPSININGESAINDFALFTASASPIGSSCRRKVKEAFHRSPSPIVCRISPCEWFTTIPISVIPAATSLLIIETRIYSPLTGNMHFGLV
ncbi:hypothetical protein D3C74_364460 [compost metagenome]